MVIGGGAFSFFFGIHQTVNPLVVGTGMRYGKWHEALHHCYKMT